MNLRHLLDAGSALLIEPELAQTLRLAVVSGVVRYGSQLAHSALDNLADVPYIREPHRLPRLLLGDLHVHLPAIAYRWARAHASSASISQILYE
jgi:hypothetical protein